MLARLPDPALFPAFVGQYTVGFDPADAADVGATFRGIALPVGLGSAVPKRRLEFAAGRYCAREALRVCAPSLAETEVGIGPSREPVWPPGIVGAITHTVGYASVAVARTADARAIGLDAETWIKEDTAEEVAASIADRAEIATIARMTGWSFARALTLVFSAKETLFKCLFPQVGRYFDFRDAALVVAERGSFGGTLLVDLSPVLLKGYSFEGRFDCDGGVVRTAMTLSAR